MGSFSWIEYLKDPQLVANFQQYFGVRPPSYYPSSNNKCSLDDWDDDDIFQSKKSKGSNAFSQGDSSFIKQRSKTSYCQNDVKSSHDLEDEVGSKNVIHNKFWYFLFSFGTALGDEAFYAFSFCFWFWNIDGAVGRRVVYVWAILMYIGQGLKDIIKWPRPSCPPVVRLERKWELEYGMPSTHAIVGAAAPFSVLIFTSTRYQYTITYPMVLSIAWCTLVCLSRIYLGMHSVLDILAGLGIVVSCFVWVIPLVDFLDPIILEDEYGALYLWLAAIILIICSPGGDRWTPARGDTVVILGSCVGLNTGAWLNYHSGVIKSPPSTMVPPYPVLWPSYGMIFWSFIRIVLGLCVIAATRASVKAIARTTIKKFILTKNQLAKASTTRTQVVTELTYKFLTYTILGFFTVYVVPAMFRYLGIQRPAFHTEV